MKKWDQVEDRLDHGDLHQMGSGSGIHLLPREEKEE